MHLKEKQEQLMIELTEAVNETIRARRLYSCRLHEDNRPYTATTPMDS